MINYNEVRPGVAIILDGEPYVCVWNNVMQKQQRRPVNQTKLRHLIKGNTVEHSFAQSDKMQEAEIEQKPAMFIYERNGEWFFHMIGKPQDRFKVDQIFIGEPSRFLKSNTEVITHWFDGNIIRVVVPIKMELKVKEAPPSIRGNTAQGGSKLVKLENGVEINVPLFINEGDVIRVNTDLGEYVERV